MATDTTTKTETTTPAQTATTPNIEDYEKRMVAQIEEAEARIETFETKAKDNRLSAEIKTIDQLKVTRETLQKKLQNLAMTSQANIVKAKADIDSAAASLKASLDDLGRKLATFSAKK
jgi:hypothetical protein